MGHKLWAPPAAAAALTISLLLLVLSTATPACAAGADPRRRGHHSSGQGHHRRRVSPPVPAIASAELVASPETVLKRTSTPLLASPPPNTGSLPVCTGLCCSNNRELQLAKATPTYWLDNAFQDGAKVQLSTVRGLLWADAAKSSTKWQSFVVAGRPKSVGGKGAGFLTVRRLNKYQVQLVAPGGRYIAAGSQLAAAQAKIRPLGGAGLKAANLANAGGPIMTTARNGLATVFNLTQVGTSQIVLMAYDGRYVTTDSSGYLWRSKVLSSTLQLFTVTEVLLPAMQPQAPAMDSRWWSNTLQDGARIQIYTNFGGYWSTYGNNSADWQGYVTAWPGIRYLASTYMTVRRLSTNTIQLRTPGGGYVTAGNKNEAPVMMHLQNPQVSVGGPIVISFQSTAATVFTVKQLADGKVQLLAYDGLWVAADPSGYMWRWSTTPEQYETFKVMEVKSVPAFRGVNLGGWLLGEPWMVPSLYEGIPALMDGAAITLQSLTTGRYVSAINGGGSLVTAAATTAGTGETFGIRRVGGPTGPLQLRAANGYFVSAVRGGGRAVYANKWPADAYETFGLFICPFNGSLIMLQASNGAYVQAKDTGVLAADLPAASVDLSSAASWAGPSSFYLNITSALVSDWQLCSGLGKVNATQRLEAHWSTFITESDFAWMATQNINAVRIPIGYWTTQEDNPDWPFVAGSTKYLDWAFVMGLRYGIRIWISMHAAFGSQNGGDSSASRDGVIEFAWPESTNIEKTLDAIGWIANRYNSSPMLAGIGVLNEPRAPDETASTPNVPLPQLVQYYRDAYKVVRTYSKCTYVGFGFRVGNASPYEFYQDPTLPDYTNVILDYHFYHVFDPTLEDKSATEIEQLVRSSDASFIKAVAKAGWLLMIGEWSNALYGSSNATFADYINYGLAQLQTYGMASSGWFFWNYNIGWDHYDDWNFRVSVQNKWLQRNSSGAWP